MSMKRHKPEETVGKLRQVDVLMSQGESVADAIRTIGVTEMAPRRATGRRDLLQLARGADHHHRELEEALRYGAPTGLRESWTALALPFDPRNLHCIS